MVDIRELIKEILPMLEEQWERARKHNAQFTLERYNERFSKMKTTTY